MQRFQIESVEGQPAAKIAFSSDAAWLSAPDTLTLHGQPETVTLRYDAAALAAPGLHVGTVWARSVTDTLAGALFGLTNTVVVAYRLDDLWQARNSLPAGRTASYFFDVPQGAGAFRVALKLAGDPGHRSDDGTAPRTTLYLFEPSGEAARERGSVDLGRESPSTASLDVQAGDLVPGVWEAVVVAPPTDRVSYEISAELSRVSFADAGGAAQTPVLHNATSGSIPARVSARVIGVQRAVHVVGKGGEAVSVATKVPAWANRLVVDVETPASVWNQITDFGVTVFDQSGVQLSQGPLDYANGRQQLTLSPRLAGQTVTVELMPAFAHLDPPLEWTANVRITYRGATDRGATINGHPDSLTITLPAGGDQSVSLTSDSTFVVPSGFQPAFEIRASGASGPPAWRWFVGRGSR
jgi:hypothetical protein